MRNCKIDIERNYFFTATCFRTRSSCSLNSGVNSGPKSSASNTWRISISDSPSNGFGQRLTHSTASSIDLTCHNQKRAISSLVSANGPSITLRFGPENRTRLPFELGWSPSPASITPAFASSSLNLPIAARSSVFGMTPDSESLLALTITIHRIVMSPLFSLRLNSTLTSNDRQLDRQDANFLLEAPHPRRGRDSATIPFRSRPAPPARMTPALGEENPAETSDDRPRMPAQGVTQPG